MRSHLEKTHTSSDGLPQMQAIRLEYKTETKNLLTNVKPKNRKLNMPNIHDLKQSKFLTKNDVTPPVLATIRGFSQENVATSGAEPEMKWCLTFTELDKPFVVNSTNGQIIAGITGSEDFEGWIGKKIVLYFEPNISFGGKLTGGIRCRAPKAGSVMTDAKQGAPAPATEPEGDCPF